MNKKLLLASLTASLTISGVAMAVGIVPPAPRHWWYIGAGANVAALTSTSGTETINPTVPTTLDTITNSRTKNNWGFNLYAGRALNNYFAAQVDLVFRGNQNYLLTDTVAGST